MNFFTIPPMSASIQPGSTRNESQRLASRRGFTDRFLAGPSGPTVGDLAQEFLKHYIFMKRRDPLAARVARGRRYAAARPASVAFGGASSATAS